MSDQQPTTEELFHALTVSIGELTNRLNGALFALHTIAREDYRGPVPSAVLVAARALTQYGVCDCHAKGESA